MIVEVPVGTDFSDELEALLHGHHCDEGGVTKTLVTPATSSFGASTGDLSAHQPAGESPENRTESDAAHNIGRVMDLYVDATHGDCSSQDA